MIQLNDPEIPPAVASVFDGFPAPVRTLLLQVRSLIFQVAAGSSDVGQLIETLKWGEPAYLTGLPGIGSTIRLGKPGSRVEHAALYVNCRTTLVSDFRDRFPSAFEYSGNRAILLPVAKPWDAAALSVCIELALTYRKRRRTLARH